MRCLVMTSVCLCSKSRVNISLLNREWQTTISIMAVVIGLGDCSSVPYKQRCSPLHYVTSPACFTRTHLIVQINHQPVQQFFSSLS